MQPSDSSIRHIRLTKCLFAIVDADDYDRLSEYAWSVAGQGYASRASGWVPNPANPLRMKKGAVMMHREVLRYDGPLQIDHINGNPLDNRKSNLRVVTPAQNAWNRKKPSNNTSGFKGVSWSKSSQKWTAVISCNGVYHHLGMFDTPEEAGAAYQAKALELHGEYARAA